MHSSGGLFKVEVTPPEPMQESGLELRTQRVLVLDGHSSAALAFVRSLGRAGCWVAVGHQKGLFSAASHSRYCSATLPYDPPFPSAAQFAQTVDAFAAANNIGVVMPMTEATVWPLAKHSSDLKEHGIVACVPQLSAMHAVSDKFWVWNTAKELGLAAPPMVLARTIDEIKQVEAWSAPIFIKDRFSIRWDHDRGVIGRVEYASTPEALQRKAAEHISRFGEVLVQSYCPGVGIGISCFMLNGRCHMPFQWERLREKDPRGSGSSAQISRFVDGELVRRIEALLARAGFEGLAMAEFRLDTKTGKAYILEINGRPWGSLQLPIHCGLDYPVRALLWYAGHKEPPVHAYYEEGTTCRSLVYELSHLENVMTGKPNDWPFAYPSSAGTLLKLAVPWYPGLHYDDLSLSDPKPGVLGISEWVGSHFRGRR